MSEQEQKASLACTEGSSDKVYFAQLTASGDGWLVTAQYGARGGTLKSADKHPMPVAYAVAEKAFNSLVKSKLAKGYVPIDAPGSTQMTDAPTVPAFTDVRPQLLNPIEANEVDRYINDPTFIAQPKHDGERRLLVLDGNDIYGVNRKGQRVPLLMSIADMAAELPVAREGRTILDGEQVGDTLHVWDVLEHEGRDLRTLPLSSRQSRLAGLFEGIIPEGASAILPTETAHDAATKRALLDRMIRDGLEGVVFKHTRSAYVPGRPASGGDCLKYKLTASATVRVRGQNSGKASIAVELKDGENWVFVGNVTIPPNHATPQPFAIVEVEYLYVANLGGCLFQPVLPVFVPIRTRVIAASGS